MAGLVLPHNETTLTASAAEEQPKKGLIEIYPDYDYTTSVVGDTLTISGTGCVPDVWMGFDGCDQIRHLIVEDGITSIEAQFREYANLEDVKLADSVKKMGNYIFWKCPKLASVEIPDTLNVIYSRSFLQTPLMQAQMTTVDGCTMFGDILMKYESTDTHVVLPDGVRVIAAGALENLPNLQELTVPDCVEYASYGTASVATHWVDNHRVARSVLIHFGAGVRDLETNCPLVQCVPQFTLSAENPYYQWDASGALLTADGKQLVHVPLDVVSYTVPDGVETICTRAMWYHTSLRQVKLPSSVRTLGNGCFQQGTSLAAVFLNDGLLTIGSYAFDDCKSLKRLAVSGNIPKSVTKIAAGAFSGCAGLEEIDIPAGISVIDNELFQGCSSLQRVSLPDTITEIGSSAFSATGLKTLTIPASVTTIYMFAFSAAALEEVTIPEKTMYFGYGLFFMCENLRKITILSPISTVPAGMCIACFKLEEVVLPETVTKIHDVAFWDTHNLRFTIPDTVTSIGREAFCNGMSGVIYVPATVTSIGKEAIGIQHVMIDEDNWYKIVDPNVKIMGYLNTEAQRYANRTGIPFLAMDFAGVLGDISQDNAVTADDAISVLRLYSSVMLGTSTAELDGIMLYAADVNQNGAIDSADAVEILKSYAASLLG